MAFYSHVYMTPEQLTNFRRKRQREFVRELTKAFKEEMDKALKKVPEEFDGIELRMLASLVIETKLCARASSLVKRRFNRSVTKHDLP